MDSMIPADLLYGSISLSMFTPSFLCRLVVMSWNGMTCMTDSLVVVSWNGMTNSLVVVSWNGMTNSLVVV